MHTAKDLHTALAVACLLLRDGIQVERIEGPDDLGFPVEAIRPLCDGAG